MSANRLRVEYLSKKDLDQIEEVSFRLLAETGILLEHNDAKAMLHGIGCEVDRGRVKIPQQVIEWALENLRPQRQVYDRDGNLAFEFGDGKLRFHNGGGAPFVYTPAVNKRRPALISDVAEITRLLDYLPNVDSITPLFGPQDVPDEMLAVASTHTMLCNTNKPVSSAALEKAEHVPYVVEMAVACSGGDEAFRARPSMSVSISPISPLHFSHDVTAAIIAVVKSGAPFHSLPAPSLGATAPITMAAALAQQHAEVLASFVIAAAAQPGALVTYSSRINPIDMRSAVSNWGGPEVGMSGACATQLAHRLGFACDSYGFSSSKPVVNAQFTYERFSNAFIPALGGADILSGVGMGDSGMIGACEIAVLDDEMIGLMKHVIEGVEVNEETLAFEMMNKVIANNEVFLAEEHTVRYMRSGAVWISDLYRQGDRQSEDDPAEVLNHVWVKVQDILKNHQPQPLPESVRAELDDILEKAAKELVPS